MQVGRIFDIMGSIVTVAAITVIVTKPNTADVITAFGNAFSSSLKTAEGNA